MSKTLFRLVLAVVALWSIAAQAQGIMPPGSAQITGNAAGNPCIPASSSNVAITVTTTANGTATAVNVNSWGFQQ